MTIDKDFEKIFNPSPLRKLWKKLFPSKEMRAYNKMYRRHRKELVKHAKQTREWDYGWLYDSVIMQIRHMYEYYTAGNNVYQSDESLTSLIDSLKYVLDLNEKLDHVWDSAVASGDYKQDFEERSKMEVELYRGIFWHIADNIMTWWD